MKVLISLSSFGAAETGRHGQLWCTDLAQQAGADGVEVRGELLRDAATELPALAGRAAVYSSPEGLWTLQGELDEVLRAVRALHEAPFSRGALRVSTSLRIDERRDKTLSMEGKVRAVEEKL